MSSIELNTNAYKLILEIEISLREFFIDSIKNYGLEDWFTEFIGSKQRDTINEISKRVKTLKNSGIKSPIEDSFLFQTYNAYLEVKKLNLPVLFHPFYYLNWTDMEELFGMKQNEKIIEKYISKTNIRVITASLRSLNNLRNDIAHSRLISNEDYKQINANYHVIANLIPNFKFYSTNSSIEIQVDTVFNQISIILNKILKGPILSKEELDSLTENIVLLKSSFWFKILFFEYLKDIKILESLVASYGEISNKPGSILLISDWKRDNMKSILEQINIMEYGKI